MDSPMRTGDVGRNQVYLPPGTPFDKKWDILKPFMKQLYIDEDQKLAEVIDNVKRVHGFIAEESQYKYHLKKWKWKKNLSTPKKEALCGIRHSRAEKGKATVFRSELLDRNIDEKKLRRFLKEDTRRKAAMPHTRDLDPRELKLLSGTSFQLGESIFLNWTVPYGAMNGSTTRSPGAYGLSPMSISTPSDILVTTPAGDAATSPNNALSPLTDLQNRKVAMDRAHMFIEGRYAALVKSLNKEEKLLMSTWLYQFWLYGFKTAKFWGRGPREWNADNLEHGHYSMRSTVPLPTTPENHSGTEIYQPTMRSTLSDVNIAMASTILQPSKLCCWSIHYVPLVQYQRSPSRQPSPEPEPDPELCNKDTWGQWPKSWKESTLGEGLLNGLASNSFSDIISDDLPIALPQIVKASKRSPTALLEEACGFSIMARNIQETTRLLGLMSDDEFERLRHRLHPVHLAITFMDGAKTCCGMLSQILYGYFDYKPIIFRTADRNSLGHTIFDNLMISILKAHTSTTPGAVDDGLRTETRFPGEEVDVCGRWDADSDCIRDLIANGRQDIPFSWKHKFCHTSAQTICHCIGILKDYGHVIQDDLIMSVPSGIYVKRCFNNDCGLKMQLTPLHTVVMVAFCLAKHGCEDEDLFGILAVLLSVLKHGSNPTYRVDLDVTALFNIEDTGNINLRGCNHEKLSPATLAERVPFGVLEKWSSSKRTGWEIICHVLRRSEKVWTGCDNYSELKHKFEGYNLWCSHYNTFGNDTALAVLWGAVQTEMLTYRRLNEDDGWISPNFNMETILENLRSGDHVNIGLVEKDLMSPVCICGSFITFHSHGSSAIRRPRADQVSKTYFSNLDDWSRTTFIDDE